MHVDRETRTATLTSQRHWDSELMVHPFLTIPGSAFAWWEGRESFHGGGLMVGDVAYGVFGHKKAGKSTLLAAAALRGETVLSDDMLTIEGDTLHCGPRCVDVRPSAALALRLTAEPFVRGRRRLGLGAAPPVAPLGGFVTLAWGKTVRLHPLSLRERLVELRKHVSVHPPTNPHNVLSLAALPMWRLFRPRTWQGLEHSLEAIFTLRAPARG